MSHSRRAGALVGLLIASLVAGGLAGAASANVPAADDAATLAVAGDAVTLQSSENDTQSGENTTIHYEGEGVTLAPSAGERITGETDLAPGTALTIKVVSEDDQAPLLETTDVTVAENGTFVGTIDLSNAQTHLPVTVYVEEDHRKIARADGTILRCTENCSSPEEWPEFRQGVFQTPHGEPVDVAVSVPASVEGPVNLTVGEESDGFAVETEVVDADGDGEITLTLKTSAAGTGSPGEYLSAGDDRIESAVQTTDAIEPPLDAGQYTLEVGPRDAPYDIGTLAIVEPSAENDDESDDGTAGAESSLDVETTGEVTFISAGDTVELGNAKNQMIRAETELEAGTALRLELTSTDPSNPFFVRPHATVTEYGTINATVDLRDVKPGSEFKLVAKKDGEALGATLGRVVDCDDGCPQVSNGANQSTPVEASNASGSADADDNESNVVEVNESGGSIPVEGFAAIGVGGLLALVGLVRFTGLLKR